MKLADMDDGSECGAASPQWLEMMKSGTLPIPELIEMELIRAKSKFPEWPTDPIHAFAIIAEECGEAQKEVLQLVYEPEKSTKENLRTEVIQLAATCHRFLENLDSFEFKPSAQHKQ